MRLWQLNPDGPVRRLIEGVRLRANDVSKPLDSPATHSASKHGHCDEPTDSTSDQAVLGNETDSTDSSIQASVTDESTTIWFERVSIRAMDMEMIDAASDCDLKFSYLARGWRASKQITQSRIETLIADEALRKFYALAPEDRSEASIELSLLASAASMRREAWPANIDIDAGVNAARELIAKFVQMFGSGQTVVAQDLDLSFLLPDPETDLRVEINRVDLIDGGSGIELIAIDCSDRMEYRHSISNDPVMWAWLLAAYCHYPVPVVRVRNQNIRLAEEEVWEVSEGETDRIIGDLPRELNRVRHELDPQPSVGRWCADCGFSHVCPASGRLSPNDLRREAMSR